MLDKLNTQSTALVATVLFVWLSIAALHHQQEMEGALTPKQIHALDVIASLTPKQKEAFQMVVALETIWNIPDDKIVQSRVIAEGE